MLQAKKTAKYLPYMQTIFKLKTALQGYPTLCILVDRAVVMAAFIAVYAFSFPSSSQLLFSYAAQTTVYLVVGAQSPSVVAVAVAAVVVGVSPAHDDQLDR